MKEYKKYKSNAAAKTARAFFAGAALCALLGTALFSCSFFGADSSDEISAAPTSRSSDASVVFSIDAATANEIAKSAGADGKTLYMDISLEGSSPRSATVAINDGSVVSFEKLQVKTMVRAVATAYVKSDGARPKKELYSGQSDWLVVNRGRNPITLTLNPIFYITFFENGGTWTNGYPTNDHYKKGDVLELPTSNDITRDGWLFAGWCTSDDGGTTLRPFTFTKDTSGDLELYAKWIDSGVQGISVTVNRDANDITLSTVAVEDPTDGPCVKFTANPPESEPGASVSYDWKVDETTLGLSQTYTFIKNNWPAGVYDISVTVTVTVGGNSKKYSAFAQVKVE